MSKQLTQTQKQSSGLTARPASGDARLEGVEAAIQQSQGYLLGIQSSEGYWVGELEADVSVAAGYIPLMYFMAGKVDPERQRKVVNYVTRKQRADGSWGTYQGGPGDINVTVQTYFALKLAGVSPQEPFMQKARDFVLGRGGLDETNTLTKVWLAIFGQFEWSGVPAMPPEIILLPDWFYFNIYEFASWSRATIVALMVVLAKKPSCPVPGFAGISELRLRGGRRPRRIKRSKTSAWGHFFLVMDRLFKAWEKMPWRPGRGLALRQAEKWIVEHQETDGSWGGIMLPWVYSLIALKSLGYRMEQPVIARGLAGLEGFIIEDETTFRLQPATSPVWDTAWAVIALAESGLTHDHPSLVKATRWLLGEEIRVGGDWRVKNGSTEPSGWCFEFENDLYPDIDDTAVVPRALLRVKLPPPEERRKAGAVARGLRWMLDMQSDDGGWAAFDRNNNRRFLAHIPFADFMTPLDPTSPDVTAHAVELLAEMGMDGMALERAISHFRNVQEDDGAWYGRWGVNYIYGTGLVLTSLHAAREDMDSEYIRRAVSWLKSCQNEDGGWGESCQTYDDPACRGAGPSTASQTAWALLGLMAAGEPDSAAVESGIDYLVKTQQGDGWWQEEAYTGTGFPGAFYLRYDMYRLYFPLMALAQYRASRECKL